MIKIVLKDPPPVNSVHIKQINSNRLYVSMTTYGVYKLQKIGDDKWAMVSLNNSIVWAAGGHSTAEKAIRSAPGDVYEFDNLKELVGWLSERLEN